MIGFVIRFLSIFTGFLFIMIVTRQLSEADFGIWIWITRLVGYAVFPAVAVNYWVTRFVARDIKAAKTGFLLILILAAIGTMVYLLIAPYAAYVSSAPLIFFIIAAFQIPLTYFKENLDSVSNGVKPQITSYGFLSFEVVKVMLAFLLMAILGPTLTSAILAVAGAQLVNIVVLLFFLKEDLSGIFDKSLAKRWLKVFWIPIYSSSLFLLSTFDVMIIISISGSSSILANYGAASVFFGIIMSLSILSSALYPRILRGGGRKDVEEVLKLTFLFAIPMCAGIFIIARPLLFMLNPIYVEAILVVRALIFYAFTLVIMNIFDFVIIGSEKVELDLESKFKDFMKSRLFILPSINLLMGIVYLISLSVVLLVTLPWGLKTEEIAFYWALTQFTTSIPFFSYKYWLARKIINFKIPWRQIFLYILASIIMVAAIQFLKFEITYTPSIYVFIFDALKLVLTGSAIYFLIVYIFDPYFRNLLKSVYVFLWK